MSRSCETYQEAMLAHLANELGEAESAVIEAHLSECAACRTCREEIEGCHGLLASFGAALRERQPAVDLVSAVLAGASEIDAGTRMIDEACLPEHPMVMPYLDGSLDDLAKARFERTLRVNPGLQEEIEALRRMDSALRLLGDEYRAKQPGVSLEPEVLAAADELSDEPDVSVVEEALWGLGEDIRARAPRVELEDQVTSSTAPAQETAPIEDALASVGRALAQSAPRVDLVRDVMDSVERARSVRQASVERAAWKTSRPFAYWVRGFGIAAAACVAIMAGIFAARWTDQQPDATRVALHGETDPETATKRPEEGTTREGNGGRELTLPAWPDLDKLPQLILKRAEIKPDDSEDGTAAEAEEKVTLADAIAQHRLGQDNNVDALKRLSEMGQLTPKQARDLIEKGGLTNQQLVAATQHLPADEAVKVLESMVADQPEDPYLRLALARAMSDNGASIEDQLAQVAAWGALDPANGLPSYMEATLYYEMGDYEAAMRALAQGGAYDESDNYSLASANAQADVLEAAGLDRDTAEYLATLLGGSEEYTDLSAMTTKLAELGAYYESVGDYESATEVYQALLELGQQVSNSATLPNDSLAGVDTVMLATQALEQLLSNPDAVVVLSQTMGQIVQMLGNFTAALGEYNALLSGDPEAVSAFVQDILMGAWDQMIQEALQ